MSNGPSFGRCTSQNNVPLDSFASAGWFPMSQQSAPVWASVGEGVRQCGPLEIPWPYGRLRRAAVPVRTVRFRNRQCGIPGTRQCGSLTFLRESTLSPVRVSENRNRPGSEECSRIFFSDVSLPAMTECSQNFQFGAGSQRRVLQNSEKNRSSEGTERSRFFFSGVF